jgi:hypothetical protein
MVTYRRGRVTSGFPNRWSSRVPTSPTCAWHSFSVFAAALTLISSPAWAHVEVETNRAYAGAKDVTLTFHVPNEEALLTATSTGTARSPGRCAGSTTSA